MLSMPPATRISALSARSMSWPNIMARMPEPHIFESVTAPAEAGRPAPSAAWRAGAWPCPAIRQLPISTSLTASPVMPARSTAALMATAPSWCAATALKSPSMPPMGVRAADTMTMESAMDGSLVRSRIEVEDRGRGSRSRTTIRRNGRAAPRSAGQRSAWRLRRGRHHARSRPGFPACGLARTPGRAGLRAAP